MSSALTGKTRNSAIELLRLVSMLAIVGFHYGRKSFDLAEQPISLPKFVYQAIYSGGGWIGNFIFFTISVWFLVGRTNTLKTGLKRIWIMEKQLLFWSILLFAVTIIIKHEGWYKGNLASLAIYSILPISLNLWWYVTSYAIFLLLLPFLERGLQLLGKSNHFKLAITVLILWGVLGLIPFFKFDLYRSVFVFVYWFILITYYKWYMSNLSRKQCYSLILSGAAIIIAYWLITNVLWSVTGRASQLQLFIFGWTLPTMMIGFGIFVLAERSTWHSKVIDFLAASAFGVYLIHMYPSVVEVWSRLIPLKDMYESSHPLTFGAGAILSIFLVCLVFDIIRQFIFRITVDRHSGKWFDILWNHLKLDRRMELLERRISHTNAIES